MAAGDAVSVLAATALEAATRSERLEACRLLGDLAGRALGAEWEVAERAAFALLEAARVADTAADRRGVIAAMGHGFRNLWLLPFVHRRFDGQRSDDRRGRARCRRRARLPGARGGGRRVPRRGRAARAAARRDRRARPDGRGASAVDRLVAARRRRSRGGGGRADRAHRDPLGARPRRRARRCSQRELEPEVQIAAVRYLAELGALEVLPVLRRLARSEDAEIRIAASLASRALKAERNRDAGERFLVALSEPDRAVRAVLARRLRTLPVADVIEQAEVLLGEDAAGVVQILGEVREPEITKFLLALAARSDLPEVVRARAIGAIEADQAVGARRARRSSRTARCRRSLRAAAVQAMGAFATTAELLERIGDLATSPSAAIRGALLWALQLARERQRCRESQARRADARRRRSDRAPPRRVRRRQPRPRQARARARRRSGAGEDRRRCGSPRTSRSASSACPAWSPRSSPRSSARTIRACSAPRRTR